jgi:hypothetical protein
MATTEHVSHTHACDLCGTEHAEEDLVPLFGARPPGADHDRPRADVCLVCGIRPISDLIKYLATAPAQRRVPRIRHSAI